jgi:hypothetical protein
MAKVGTVGILYRAGTISHQGAVHPEYTLGALNVKEEEEEEVQYIINVVCHKNCSLFMCIDRLF